MMHTAYLIVAMLLGILVAAVIAIRMLARRNARDLAESEARLRAGFQEIATAALRDNSDLFLKLAREAFGREQAGVQALIDPIRSALEKTETQVGAMERERRDAFSTLRAQIETMALGQSALQRETHNLVTALRRPEVRGRWGELTLRRVVELAGLSEHCDFTEQPSVGAPGNLQRPDMVVHLPEGRELVIDAKTPLDAYLEAIDAPTHELRAQCLARHAQQLEARVRELGSKAYWTQFAHSPEFAVLFLPGDQFLSSALAERPELLDNALRAGVIITTPSTLIGLLKTIAHGWRQIAVAENAAQIRDLGQELHRRLVTFMGHFSKAGRLLGSAVEAYNSAVGSLERQVLPSARRFTELGAATGEPIPRAEIVEQPVRAPLPAAGEDPPFNV
jgi:DNA recombination protein RmuC